MYIFANAITNMHYIYLIIILYILFVSVDSWDNNVVLIGTIVGVDCTVIIIIVITNIMVWIYCFRKRNHTDTICKGMYTYICDWIYKNHPYCISTNTINF